MPVGTDKVRSADAAADVLLRSTAGAARLNLSPTWRKATIVAVSRMIDPIRRFCV